MTFETWLDTLGENGDFKYWADNYEFYCENILDRTRHFYKHHVDTTLGPRFRDKLLRAAKRLCLDESSERHQSSRPYLWTLELNRTAYDDLVRNHADPATRARFFLATTYELGEMLVVHAQPGCGRTCAEGDIEQQKGMELHRRCSWVRAQLRRQIDRWRMKDIRRLGTYFHFLAFDLACTFEWRIRGLREFTKKFEKILDSKEFEAPIESEYDLRRPTFTSSVIEFGIQTPPIKAKILGSERVCPRRCGISRTTCQQGGLGRCTRSSFKQVDPWRILGAAVERSPVLSGNAVANQAISRTVTR